MVEKLERLFCLDAGLIGWIFDFLTNRSQQVRVNGILSSLLTSSTGSPQGCVLSAFLYILYTNDCFSHHANRFIIKYADDSIVVSLLGDDEDGHGQVLDDFLSWCEDAFLQLNISKTKEMCVDFRKSSPVPQNSVVHGRQVELVDTYKYLGTTFDSKLRFDVNCEMLCKKGQQRLYCLRRLATFRVDKSLMRLFYSAFIESIISFSIICWYGNLNIKDKNHLGRIVRTASKIAGVNFSSLDHVFQRQMLKKAKSIRMDSSHPLSSEYKLLPSGLRLECAVATTNRHKFSFVPASIQALNADMRRR